MLKQAQTLLKKFYGYDSFRPGQQAIITSLIEGKDTLAIMPTGAGKSVCFQIPALLFPGISIVVSPLISLMKDQVDTMLQQGIPATYINSSLSSSEVSRRIYDIGAGRYKLVYVAPERLSTEYFQAILNKTTISMVAIDEAHCLSQWGHDFRPSYQSIHPFIKALPQRPIIGAFTATATPEVKADIITLLGLYKPHTYVSGFDRPNLHFSVLRGEDKQKFITSYLNEHSDQSGIIYAATRKEVDGLCAMLRSKGYNAGRYHAGMSDEERSHAQDDFLYDRIQVMAATNAFGMGIDKSNVRFVIHNNMPRHMEAYYQEAGRSGRDGAPGECILLFSAQDIMLQKFLIDKSIESAERKQHELTKLQSMVDYCHTPDCLRRYIISYFGETNFAETCDNCGNCNDDSERVDITIDAQKVFSCIYRLHERFGMGIIAEVLKGSKNKKLLQLELNRQSTYGLFAKRSIPEIKALIQRLAATQYITPSDGEYPVLKLTPMAFAVMKNQASVWQKTLKLPKEAPVSVEDSLFDELRKLRRSLAEKENVPPYHIFTDSTLRDMCAKCPTTPDEMREVNGIGEIKLAKYGRIFLDKLIEINPTPIKTTSEPKKKKPSNDSKIPTHLLSIDYYRQGYSINEIAKERSLTALTIENHIFKACEEGLSIDLDKLIPTECEKEIIAVIEKLGASPLRPLKDALPEEITYSAIRAVIYKHNYQKK